MRVVVCLAIFLRAHLTECAQDVVVSLEGLSETTPSIFHSECASVTVGVSSRGRSGTPGKADWIGIYSETLLQQLDTDEARAWYFVQTGKEAKGAVWTFKPGTWRDGSFTGAPSQYTFERVGDVQDNATVSLFLDYINVDQAPQRYRAVYHSAANTDPTAIAGVSRAFTLSNDRPSMNTEVLVETQGPLVAFSNASVSVSRRPVEDASQSGKQVLWTKKDWVGIYREAAVSNWTDCGPSEKPVAWQYIGDAPGEDGHAEFGLPEFEAGSYVALLLSNDKHFMLGASAPFAVSAPSFLTTVSEGALMFRSDETTRKLALPVGTLTPLLSWNVSEGRMTLLGKTFSHAATGRQWFNQMVFRLNDQVMLNVHAQPSPFGTMKVLLYGRSIVEQPPEEGVSHLYAWGDSGRMRTSNRPRSYDIGGKRANMLHVEVGGVQFSLFTSKAAELDSDSEQVENMHLDVALDGGFPVGATGLLPELASQQTATGATGGAASEHAPASPASPLAQAVQAEGSAGTEAVVTAERKQAAADAAAAEAAAAAEEAAAKREAVEKAVRKVSVAEAAAKEAEAQIAAGASVAEAEAGTEAVVTAERKQAAADAAAAEAAAAAEEAAAKREAVEKAVRKVSVAEAAAKEAEAKIAAGASVAEAEGASTTAEESTLVSEETSAWPDADDDAPSKASIEAKVKAMIEAKVKALQPQK